MFCPCAPIQTDVLVPLFRVNTNLNSLLYEYCSHPRGQKGKGAVFTTTLIASSRYNSHPDQVVASLDDTLYDNYLCLVASNKQQIQWRRIRKNPQQHWITGNF